MMRYLLFGSFLIIMGCAPKVRPSAEGKTDTCLLTAVPDFKSELYRASVDVYGNHISGLMFFKTLPDSSKNVVFTTETGLTFFNFSWDKTGKFNVQHVIKKLDRKAVINLLRKDLQLIMVPTSYSRNADLTTKGLYVVELKKETAFFTVSDDCSAITQAEVRYKDKTKTKASFFPPKKNIPDSIYIEHLNFKMQLALGRINRDHASE